MENCTLCPRNCHANRTQGQIGYCGQTAEITYARAALHMWEEPCISGTRGSGTVFFSGCNLRCIFCQNYKIAHKNNGKKISIKELSNIFLDLQEKGAHNINLVTPTHFTPQIAAALRLAKKEGLCLPIIYNTSSYELVSSLQLLDGLIDIYLPDCKYMSSSLSQSYSYAPNYFAYASKAIAEMYRQVGAPLFDPASGLMKKGMIVRHLILPGQTKDSKKILRYLHNTYGNTIYISIMNQYTPVSPVSSIEELNRPVTKEEYSRVVYFAQRIGIENGFIQEGETASESFIPSFYL